MTRYPAPWSRSLRTSTWAGGVVLLAVSAGLPAAILHLSEGQAPVFPAILPAVLVPAVALLAWALAPRSFLVDGRGVHVERRLSPFVIPLDRIRGVGPVPPEALRGLRRVVGTAGLFGYFGRFWGRNLGRFRMYATRCDRLVVVETSDGRFVLSPEPPERFVEEVIERAPGAALAVLDPTDRGPLPRRLWLVAVPVALVLLAVGLGLAASWAYAPRAVTVTEDAIRIEREWAGPAEIPLAGVRSAERLAPARLRGTIRTGGVAMGRIGYGNYRSPSLGPFRLYAWRRGPCVLLETVEGPIVLTPEDPDRFIADVRAALPAR